MAKYSVVWTSQAQVDLREIRRFIARDAPRTASAFVSRLMASVGRLKTFPESGAVVPEIGRSDIREILFGNYRIIYSFDGRSVDILTVYHGARLLGDVDSAE